MGAFRLTKCNVALRKESVDRNIDKVLCSACHCTSLSARRAWIEIRLALQRPTIRSVALRKESVDRNDKNFSTIVFSTVALRKESVDRNPNAVVHVGMIAWSLSARRAWIEILCWHVFSGSRSPSLSARRAWIEIQTVNSQTVLSPVALRKESVDRNFLWGRMDLEITPVALRKESVDRNWCSDTAASACYTVALRKESVDRNAYVQLYSWW